LQIEWCKAYTRVQRWGEEVQLVTEEVHRVGVSLEYRAQEWEDRVRAVPVSAEARAQWDNTIFVHGTWAVERTEGAVSYGLKQAQMLWDIAARITISMTEERRGRGKKQRVVVDDWPGEEGGEEREAELVQLDDLRDEHMADNDFVLGGGADED
jgi:hypothetical protein